MKTVKFTSNRSVVINPGNEGCPGLALHFSEDDQLVGLEVQAEGGPRFCLSREAALVMADIIVSELAPDRIHLDLRRPS
jgi:hypothetical protein